MAQTFLGQDRQIDEANYISEVICNDPPEDESEAWKSE